MNKTPSETGNLHSQTKNNYKTQYRTVKDLSYPVDRYMYVSSVWPFFLTDMIKECVCVISTLQNYLNGKKVCFCGDWISNQSV